MKKIIYYLIIVWLYSCNRNIPSYKCEQFKKGDYRFEISTYNMLWAQLVNNNLYFVHRNDEQSLLRYNIDAHSLDTLTKRDKIIDIAVLNDSCIYYTNVVSGKQGYRIEKLGAGDYDYFKNAHQTIKHPYWNDNFVCMSVYGLPLIMIEENHGIINCRNLYCYADDYSILIKNKVPTWMRFEIDDSLIKPVSFFGTYPTNHPIDNYYNAGQLYCFYNNKTHNILNYTCIDNNVVLCDSLGNKIKDVYFGSDKFHLAPYPKSDKNSMPASNYYYLNNTTYYETIGYDEYRNVYLRVLLMPRLPDKDAMTREDIIDFLMIVADENLKIKYEVFFDGAKYFLPFGRFLINKNGVLIYEKETGNNKNSHNAYWFVFD